MIYTPEVGDLLRGPGDTHVLIGTVNALGGSCDDCFDGPWDRYTNELFDGWTVVGNVLKDRRFA